MDYVEWKTLFLLVLLIPVFISKASITGKSLSILAVQLISSVYLILVEDVYKSELQVFLITWIAGGCLYCYASHLEGLFQNPWTEVNIIEDEMNLNDIFTPLSLN
jgi:ABC-type microcin C transport system permease subunit YejB